MGCGHGDGLKVVAGIGVANGLIAVEVGGLTEMWVTLDSTKVLHPYRSSAVVYGQEFIVIPSNNMCFVMGYNMVIKVDTITEVDESPMKPGSNHTDAEGLCICAI